MQLFRFRRSPGARPLVWGHRGVRGPARSPVENTMPAFERAIEAGADGIELDVRTTRDGAVVVMHDPELRRLTDGRDERLVSSLDLRDLQAVELRDDTRTPTLAEVLDLADAHGILVNVELKHDTHDMTALATGVARLLRGRARVASRVLFSSFEPKLLAAVAVLLPDVPRAFLFHEGQRFAKTPVAALVARTLGAVAVHPERTLCSHARIGAWRARGFLVNVWTVNDEREAIDLARLDVDGIITDDPEKILSALRQDTSGPAISRS